MLFDLCYEWTMKTPKLNRRTVHDFILKANGYEQSCALLIKSNDLNLKWTLLQQAKEIQHGIKLVILFGSIARCWILNIKYISAIFNKFNFIKQMWSHFNLRNERENKIRRILQLRFLQFSNEHNYDNRVVAKYGK